MGIAGSTMRGPNLVICGVRKAGTTSLFYYLSQHPDIGACRTKEPSYFSACKYGREPGPLAEYLALFAHCQRTRYRMEGTPGYFSGGAAVAGAIARTLDEPRVIVILRNPVDTFVSNYNFLRSRLRLPAGTTIEQYLDACDARHRDGRDACYEHRDYNSIRAGLYHQFLPAWADAFGERFRVVFFEDFVSDQRRTVEQLCRWLDLPQEPARGFDYSVENKTEQCRVQWLQQAALALNRRLHHFFREYHLVKKALRAAYYRVNRDTGGNATVPLACRERLDACFAPSNRIVAGQLRRLGYAQLPPWLDDVPQPGSSRRARDAGHARGAALAVDAGGPVSLP